MSNNCVLREELPNLVAVLDGKLTTPQAIELFAAIRARVALGGVSGLIYDARNLTDFEKGVIPEAKPSAKWLDERQVRIAVITEKTAVRFGLSALQLVMRRKLWAVKSMEEALAAVSG